ncbi:MAG: patatin-like phospholipase family protein [Bacteroidota bacterium]
MLNRLRRWFRPDVSPPDKLALVLSGGGARGAYQAGVLRYVAKRLPDLRFPLMTGVSAGAINASFLANQAVPLTEAAERLAQLWSSIETDRVIDGEFNNMRLAWQIIRGRSQTDGPGFTGVFGTEPLRAFLRDALNCRAEENGCRLAGVVENIASGQLEALAVTTVNYQTGQSITWVDGGPESFQIRPNRRLRHAPITVDHIMASASLPFLFPAVQVGDHWYGDGGVRLATPLSPAIHLGATRLFVVSTRHNRTRTEADVPEVVGYPPPAQVMGILMSAIFLDNLEQDALNLERINQLVRQLPPDERNGLREIDLYVIRPSVDLNALARQFEPEVEGEVGLFGRLLGTRKTSTPRWLSMVLFEPSYIAEVMRIGELDAEAQWEEIEGFLAASPGV